MKEAAYYISLKNKLVQCKICPRNCIIKENDSGFCKSRINLKGKLFSKVYAAPCALNIDPIEKKPLFHFLPGSKTFSIGTAGCNLRCKFCQNWKISQAVPEETDFINLSPEEIIVRAIKSGCKSIAYTYTEPSIFFEYVLDIAKLAHKHKLKNIMVTNGFINQEPLKELCKYIDAANIDWKGSGAFYRKYTGAWIAPVLETLKLMKKLGVWIEITNLLIPKLNNNPRQIKSMCKWIAKNLGTSIPLHFSRFHADYIMTDIPATPEKNLRNAYDIAKTTGFEYVYLGNIRSGNGENTICPKCKELLIKRDLFEVKQNNLEVNKCHCGNTIPGIWT